MAFRFQKRVKVAPGLRLNISKKGISTSFGKRGISVNLGRRGLYGNIGLPGSGLSYRTRLDHLTQKTFSRQEKDYFPKAVSLKYEKTSSKIVFVDEHNQQIPLDIERDIKREFPDEINLLFEQKEEKMNIQTNQLLELHKNILKEKSVEELKELARNAISFHLEPPMEKEIFEEMKDEFDNKLSFLERLQLILPSRRKLFLEKVQQEAKVQYNSELAQYEQAKEDYEMTKQQRMEKVDNVINGSVSAMEIWLEEFLAELDFPLETNVSFNILTTTTVNLDVDLPQMEEIPLTKAEILKSGKLKIHKKSQKELREHYAVMVGGTALYLCSYVFSLLPTCTKIIISGYTQVKNKATGYTDDQYIYSLKVDRRIFYSLNMNEVHPIAAFSNFEPIMNATKTFIFREITPYALVEEDE